MSGVCNFVHTHVHTTYSLLDGACQIQPLVKRVKALGMSACAITDHGNLFGLKSFYNVCRREGVKPLLGCETYVAFRGLSEKSDPKVDKSGNHLILLAKNIVGYRNLLQLISIAHIDGFYYRPRIDKELLAKFHEGLICTSACLAGEVPQLLSEKRWQDAQAAALRYKEIFGDDYYLEIMLHASPHERSALMSSSPERLTQRRLDGDEEPLFIRQAKINRSIIDLGKKLDIKVIATNDTHFLMEEDAEAHDILICLNQGKKVQDEKRLRYTGQEWLKSYDEMVATFSGEVEQIHNTMEIAAKIEDFSIDSPLILPAFPIPKSFGTEDEYRAKYTADKLKDEFGERFETLAAQGIESLVRIKFESDYLAEITWRGAQERWPDGISDDIKNRIEFELDTIKKMGFPGYFLIVCDYIAAARGMGVSVGPGRGSAAGSAVAYCLKITNVNPIEYELLFERFLNPDRISMPDIDVDFDDDGRARVLNWVTEKYGPEHVAHIVTFGQMAPKSAIKDVCRVMDIPLKESNRLAALVPDGPQKSFLSAMKANPALEAEACGKDPVVRKILELACKLDGTTRQPGIHACGVIISRDKLTRVIPVMPTENESLLTTQYDGHFVEEIGLLKMDFLGLKTLTVIKECLAGIKEDTGVDIDIDNVPLNDKETYELFTRGETTGLFQFESEGMKRYLRELKPTCLEDLMAMNALYRPGPMRYIPQFINRKFGLEPIVYDHPMMEKYLHSTYGICVYQEQVMLLSRHLGGFTRGQSDSLRKAMGKKSLATMEALKLEFLKGCLANKEFRNAPCARREEDAVKLVNKIWDDWRAFAEYAFNKSHAVCYAYLAYQTGFLKAHYKAEFMCAQISSELAHPEKLPGLIADVIEQGLSVMPPDVNTSLSRFSPGEDSVRYGLVGVKGVGVGAAEAIVNERKANGLYRGFVDFCERINPFVVNKRVIDSLIKAGAFDSFGLHRARLASAIDFVLSSAQVRQRERESGQQNLFDAFSVDTGLATTDDSLPDCPKWTTRETLAYEREMIGIYLTGNPLDRYSSLIKDLSTKNFEKVANYQREEAVDVRICGLATAIVNKVTKIKKENMAIITLENGANRIEALLFPRAMQFGLNATALQVGQPLVVAGEAKFRDGKTFFSVNELSLLCDAVKDYTREISIIVPCADEQLENIAKLRLVVASHPGKTPFKIYVETSDGSYAIIEPSSEIRLEPSFKLIEEVEGLLGRNTLRLNAKPEVYAEYTPPRRWQK